MKYAEGKQEYHDIYPEFNSAHEHMIKHKERSGASAALMAAVAALTTLAALLNLNLFGRTVITPKLLSATPTSAQVEVLSQLDDPDISYPIRYQLYPYFAQKTPVTKAGKLLLTNQELSDSGSSPVLTGEIYDPNEILVFKNLQNDHPFLLVFLTDESENDGGLMEEALLITLPPNQLKPPAVPEIPPVSPAPPITPVPPVTPVPPPVTPAPPTPDNGATPEQMEPGTTDDTRLFWEDEIVIEERKKWKKPPSVPDHHPWGSDITPGP
ncbi:MAG: hypothetical protein II914_03420 [Clostridia bacterium]|nr:hypothetical protein [Clostridia bacterium]